MRNRGEPVAIDIELVCQVCGADMARVPDPVKICAACFRGLRGRHFRCETPGCPAADRVVHVGVRVRGGDA